MSSLTRGLTLVPPPLQLPLGQIRSLVVGPSSAHCSSEGDFAYSFTSNFAQSSKGGQLHGAERLEEHGSHSYQGTCSPVCPSPPCPWLSDPSGFSQSPVGPQPFVFRPWCEPTEVKLGFTMGALIRTLWKCHRLWAKMSESQVLGPSWLGDLG